jgi:hypothetical protein
MELETIFTAVLVIGIVWGGVLYFLIRAIKFEKTKNSDQD